MKQKRLIMMLAVLAAAGAAMAQGERTGGHHGSHAISDGIF